MSDPNAPNPKKPTGPGSVVAAMRHWRATHGRSGHPMGGRRRKRFDPPQEPEKADK